MTKHLVYVLFLGCCVIASAKAEQGCPYVSAIKSVEDAYQVNDARGHWQSSKVKERGFIDRFVGAIFRADKDQDVEDGEVECVYLASRGRRVTLRYVSSTPNVSMSLVHNFYWLSSVDPLGQTVYICQDSQPDNCKVMLKKPMP